MTKDLWINLPVKDLKKAKAFFINIGFKKFADLDGHRWNVLHMDFSKMSKK